MYHQGVIELFLVIEILFDLIQEFSITILMSTADLSLKCIGTTTISIRTFYFKEEIFIRLLMGSANVLPRCY